MCIFLSLLGCERRSVTPPDTLVVALSSAPATLDPRRATDAVGSRITSLIFNSLVRLGPDLNPVPEAAERWTHDGDDYTFYLRKDLRFHNGRPLEAEDVEFSFALISSPKSPFSSIMDLVKDVKVSTQDGRIAVKIRLKCCSERFLRADLPSLKILPKAETLAAGDDFGQKLIGTGPFRLKRQSLDQIELEGVHAATKHLLFKVIHDDFTRYQKLMKGELDIAQGEIGADRVADFEARPNEFHVETTPTLNTTYILINFKDPLLRQKNVREALARSILRSDLIRYKLHGFAEEAATILSPRLFYFDPRIKNPPYDPAEARRLISSGGWAGRHLVLKTSSVPSSVDNGKVLAYQMSQSGLKVDVQSFEWGTYYNDVKHGNFQLATMNWVGTVDPDLYKQAFHSAQKPPGLNRGSYENAALDALLEKADVEPDVNKRKKYFDQVQETVHNDLAIIPLWHEDRSVISRKSVRDYKPTITGDYWPLVEAKKVP